MTLDELCGTGGRSLLLVHGRDFKPSAEAYCDISLAALRAGLERDYPDCVAAFDFANKDLAWYGDINAEILAGSDRNYDAEVDLGDRRNALRLLREIPTRKRFNIAHYDRLPGKSAVREFFADLVAPAAGSIGLGGSLIGAVAKDVAIYFDHKLDVAERVRERLRNKLRALIDRGDRIALLSHGSGSIVAYDVLWQLTHDPDLKDRYGSAKIDLWVTMGAPLGDRFIRKRLLGASEKGADRYPQNVISWSNVSAEDDYTCHDNTLADDFRTMLQERVVSAVNDFKIFNLAVRFGKSNPHSSVGYYIHPRVSKILADWLTAERQSLSPKYTF